jgi:hypothetical protein
VRLLIVAWADFRERTSRFSILVYAAAALWLGTLAVPDTHAAYFVLDLNGYRGLYNSAWISGVSGFVLVTLLAVAGIFPIRTALERDRLIGTQDIVAASPVPARTFALGKWLSNVAVLGAICAIFLCGAIAMQLVRAEDRHADLLRYGVDFGLIVMPFCALVAAVAVAFEALAPLRGVLGGTLYVLTMFWLCAAVAAVPIGGVSYDPLGLGTLMSSLSEIVPRAPGSSAVTQQLIGTKPNGAAVATFVWTGISWNAWTVFARVVWFAIAPGIVLLAAARFARRLHETAAGGRRPRNVPAHRFPALAVASPVTAELAVVLADVSPPLAAFAALTALVSVPVPLDAAWHAVCPLLAIAPLGLWSALGVRDARYDTGGLVASASRSRITLVSARWAAGTLAAIVPWSPLLLRALAAGEAAAAGAAIVLLAALAATALALGAWTRSPHAFEGLFVIVWFLGPLNHVASLDFIGALTAAPATAATYAAAVALAAIVLTIAARTGRS